MWKFKKTMKLAEFDQLDVVMYRGLFKPAIKDIPFSDPVTMAKAVDMNKILDGDPAFKKVAQTDLVTFKFYMAFSSWTSQVKK